MGMGQLPRHRPAAPKVAKPAGRKRCVRVTKEGAAAWAALVARCGWDKERAAFAVFKTAVSAARRKGGQAVWRVIKAIEDESAAELAAVRAEMDEELTTTLAAGADMEITPAVISQTVVKTMVEESSLDAGGVTAKIAALPLEEQAAAVAGLPEAQRRFITKVNGIDGRIVDLGLRSPGVAAQGAASLAEAAARIAAEQHEQSQRRKERGVEFVGAVVADDGQPQAVGSLDCWKQEPQAVGRDD